jgi:hypothetical protein
MTKSEQQKRERWGRVEMRRYFAKIRKKQGTFGKPFAKTNTVYSVNA